MKKEEVPGEVLLSLVRGDLSLVVLAGVEMMLHSVQFPHILAVGRDTFLAARLEYLFRVIYRTSIYRYT